ncbi:lysosomal alpha-mannosidase-like [Diorhabda sublineata]|uniref:lysosomal alpha-mannosidase-like n=1 Tax=Diorhabda sublineata TaxID=1163346 RepID=UPI0024E05269|nr:lysosomal alpha-mannosidase-like [Diorhabda sublineata]
MELSILLLGFTISWANSAPTTYNNNAVGCVKCHSVVADKINVHLIPHSHDDVGWLKTADQYYYGMNTSTQQAGVQYIITSVYEALLEEEDRRFIQVETEFFWRWWNHQSDEVKLKYKNLVDNGQIEMVNGAWSMNDEACSNYQSTIDQFTWGLRTLDETVGKCGIPRIGWQIDPFGHSREQVSLLAQMGYDAIMFARLDHDDKTQRQKRKALDFAWQGSANLDDSVLFGSAFATSLYFPPDGFCWDYKCTDDTIDDDPKSPDYNILSKIQNFTAIINKYKEYFPTNNVIIPMGGDFQYEAASKNYINMDRFIKAFANHTELNVIYSTPSCYVEAVNNAMKNSSSSLTLKEDDFFPYSDSNHSFWTGYFSSRPNSKRFERIGHNVLQVAKQLYAQGSFSGENFDKNLKFLKEAMGVMQHHDAITGTEKQQVANDYVRRLSRGIEHAEKDFGTVLGNLLNLTININLESCLLTNISICSVSQNSEQFIVIVYNPLSWTINHYVRLPVEEADYEINPKGTLYDLIPTISDFSYVDEQLGRPSEFELVFAATDIPPMGFKLYHIKKSPKSEVTSVPTGDSAAFKLSNNTHLLKSITLGGKTLGISQTFGYYSSETGERDKTGVASGAYIFRPTAEGSRILENVKLLRKFSGNVVDEVQQKWTTDIVDIYQTIRWYKKENYIELDWIVGNIDIVKYPGGKEIISKFTITDDFDNKHTFYTDSNGREMIRRVKNKRPDYSYNSSVEPISSNYYPVTSRIVIKDEEKDIEVAVLTDRSQGGSSLEPYEMELMVHRRILNDDHKGVEESLNETEFGAGIYVRGSHYLFVGNKDTSAAQERILAHKKLLQPWVGLTATNLTYDDLENTQPNKNLQYQALNEPLPDNVNILTFEPWTDGKYLLRLEHIMEKNDDKTKSQPVTVDIANAFKYFSIVEMEEMTLGANQLLSEFNKREKYIWKTNKGTFTKKYEQKNEDKFGPVPLEPMQIRTFVVKLGPAQLHGNGIVIQPTTILICLFIILTNLF